MMLQQLIIIHIIQIRFVLCYHGYGLYSTVLIMYLYVFVYYFIDVFLRTLQMNFPSETIQFYCTLSDRIVLYCIVSYCIV